MKRHDLQTRLLSLCMLVLLLICPARALADAPGGLLHMRAHMHFAPDDDDAAEGFDADGMPFDMTAPSIDGTTAAADSTQADVALEEGIASDDVLRMQLRLIELGYRLAPASGVSDALDQAALKALALQNPSLTDTLPNAGLFGANIVAAKESTVLSDGTAASFLYVSGLPLPWSDVQQRLVPDEIYTLTLASSGIVFHMRYLEGENHAEMGPELAWDDATLQNQLSAQGSSDKLPAVLVIGKLHIACSISVTPFAVVDENGMHRYCLYFTNSRSHLCNIVDAEHQRMIALATQS